MTVKVAINGFGRIGRAILRANFELEPAQRKIQIVAINDLASPEANAHLTEFDSTHGRFGKAINVFEDAIEIEGEKIQMYSEKNPVDLPWRSLGVDIVLECTGTLRIEGEGLETSTSGRTEGVNLCSCQRCRCNCCIRS